MTEDLGSIDPPNIKIDEFLPRLPSQYQRSDLQAVSRGAPAFALAVCESDDLQRCRAFRSFSSHRAPFHASHRRLFEI